MSDKCIVKIVTEYRGAKGAKGDTGNSGSTLSLIAGEDLAAFKIVYKNPLDLKAFYADKNAIESADKIVGMTLEAASAGNSAEISIGNEVTNLDWDWDLDKDLRLFLDSSGEIVQGAPDEALVLVKVGIVLSNTKILVRISDSILLEGDEDMVSQKMVASENLAAGDLVNIFNDNGTTKARKANNAQDRQAHGFVLSAAAANSIAVIFLNGKITGLSGFTGGATIYLGENGQPINTAPTTSGYIIQEIGTALSATEIFFNPNPIITIA
ncbi:MAG: hypothetical protein R3D71_06040 [Rickettsiales bacterium]